MEKIGSLFPNFESRAKANAKKRRTERGDLLEYFLSEINPDRVKSGRKPFTYAGLNAILSWIPTKDLYALKSKMSDSKIPSSVVFWLEIRPRE